MNQLQHKDETYISPKYSVSLFCPSNHFYVKKVKFLVYILLFISLRLQCYNTSGISKKYRVTFAETLFLV